MPTDNNCAYGSSDLCARKLTHIGNFTINDEATVREPQCAHCGIRGGHASNCPFNPNPRGWRLLSSKSINRDSVIDALFIQMTVIRRRLRIGNPPLLAYQLIPMEAHPATSYWSPWILDLHYRIRHFYLIVQRNYNAVLLFLGRWESRVETPLFPRAMNPFDHFHFVRFVPHKFLWL